jgi:hypothetical protein
MARGGWEVKGEERGIHGDGREYRWREGYGGNCLGYLGGTGNGRGGKTGDGEGLEERNERE